MLDRGVYRKASRPRAKPCTAKSAKSHQAGRIAQDAADTAPKMSAPGKPGSFDPIFGNSSPPAPPIRTARGPVRLRPLQDREAGMGFRALENRSRVPTRASSPPTFGPEQRPASRGARTRPIESRRLRQHGVVVKSATPDIQKDALRAAPRARWEPASRPTFSTRYC